MNSQLVSHNNILIMLIKNVSVINVFNHTRDHLRMGGVSCRRRRDDTPTPFCISVYADPAPKIARLPIHPCLPSLSTFLLVFSDFFWGVLSVLF